MKIIVDLSKNENFNDLLELHNHILVDSKFPLYDNITYFSSENITINLLDYNYKEYQINKTKLYIPQGHSIVNVSMIDSNSIDIKTKFIFNNEDKNITLCYKVLDEFKEYIVLVCL